MPDAKWHLSILFSITFLSLSLSHTHFISHFFLKLNVCTVCVFSILASSICFGRGASNVYSLFFDVVVILTGRFSLIVSLHSITFE